MRGSRGEWKGEKIEVKEIVKQLEGVFVSRKDRIKIIIYIIGGDTITFR